MRVAIAGLSIGFVAVLLAGRVTDDGFRAVDRLQASSVAGGQQDPSCGSLGADSLDRVQTQTCTSHQMLCNFFSCKICPTAHNPVLLTGIDILTSTPNSSCLNGVNQVCASVNNTCQCTGTPVSVDCGTYTLNEDPDPGSGGCLGGE